MFITTSEFINQFAGRIEVIKDNVFNGKVVSGIAKMITFPYQTTIDGVRHTINFFGRTLGSDMNFDINNNITEAKNIVIESIKSKVDNIISEVTDAGTVAEADVSKETVGSKLGESIVESGVAVVEEVMSEKITPPAPTLDSSKNVDVNSQENVVKGSMKDYFAPDLSDNTVKQTEQKVSQEYKMDDLYDTPTLESQKKVDVSDNVTSNANAAGVKIDGFNWLEEYFAQEKSLASDADTLKNMLSEEAISGGNPYLKTVDEIIQKMIDAQTSGLDLNATQEVQALIDATKKLKTGEVILNRAGVLDGETPVIVSNKMANKYGEIVKQVQVGLDSGTFTKTDAQKMLELLKEKGVKSTESITELKTKLEESVYETTIEEIMSGKITPPESTGTLKGSLLEKIKSKFGKPNTDTTTSDFISQPFSKGGSAISGGYSLSDLYSEPSMDGTSTSTDIASNIGKDYVSITPNVGEQGILKFCRDKYKTKIVEELGKYYGDAGYDIHKMFESGKTATQILSELNGKKKLDFENFLQNTISGRYLSTLSEQEILALRKYCGNGAQLVNGMLRTKKINGDIDGIDAHKFIEYMDSAIERYGGLECTTQLFRGISVRSFIKPFMKKYGALFSFDMSNLDEVYASIKTLEGKEFGDLGYMSTSPGYDTSFANSSHYPVVLDITAPTGTKGAYINQISGFYNSENELLLARNTTLRITEILPPAVDTNGNNKIVVKCEVVPVSESGSGKVTLSETVGRLKGSLVEKIKSKFGKPSPDAASDFISKPFNEGGSVTGDQYSFSDLYSEPSIDGPSTSTDIASNADFAPLTLDSSKNVDVNSQENVVKSGMEDYFAPDLSDNIVKQTEQKVSQEYNMDDLYDTPTLEPQKKVDVSDNVSNNQVVDSNNNIASNTNADFAPPTLDGSKSVDVNPQENVVKSGMEDYFTPNLSDNTVKQAEQKVGQDYKMEDLYDTPTLESQKEVVQPQADTNTDVVEETFTDTKEFDKTLSETNTDTTASENLISADSVASLNGPSVNEMVYDMLQPSKLSGYDEWGILIELSEKIDNKTMLYKNFESEYMKFDHMVKDINNALNEVMETGTSYVTIRNDMLSKMNTTFEVIDQKLYEIENMSFEGVTDESLLELLHDAKTDLMKRYDKFGTALKEIETEVYNGKHFDESKLSKEAKASLTENSIDVQVDETITPPTPTLDGSKNVDVSDNIEPSSTLTGVKTNELNWLEEYFAQEKSLASDANTLKNMLSEEAISDGNSYLKTVDEIIQKMIDAQESGLDLNTTQEVQALIDATKKLKPGEVILNRAGVLDGETPVVISNKIASKYGEIVTQVQVGLDSGTFTKTDAQKMLELLKEKGVKSTESITELKTKLEESAFETIMKEIESGEIAPPTPTGKIKGSLVEKIKSKFGKPNTDATTSDFISQPFSEVGSVASMGYSLNDLYSEPSMDGTSTSTDIASNIGKDYVSITPNVGEQGILKFCRDKYKTKIVEELGKYYGDAGYDIHKMFESGKTATQILSELNGKKKLDFENFLQNTISGRYLSTLSEQEILALRKYTDGSSVFVNSMLRAKKINGEIDGIDAHKFIEYMDSAIERYGGLECTTQLFRGISVHSFIKPFMKKYGALFNFDMSNLDEVYASIKTLEGKEFGDLGYMSTSPGYDTSFAKLSHYPVVLDITAPTGTKGAYINQISGFYNLENELLLARDTTLRITEILPPAVDTNGNDKIVVKCVII